MKKDCFHTPTHTSSPPKLATTHANTHRSTPRCPGLPQLVEWGHSLGKALSSLHLVVSVIYSECYVARDSWQEVRAGPQSRTRVLTWQKRPKDTSAVLFSFIDVFCTHAHTENLHTHTLSAMPFTLNTAVFLCELRACPLLHHCWTYPEGEEVGHISVIIEKRFNMGVWSLYCSLRSEVKGGRVKKGLTPKNSCQPVGCRCRSAPMGLTKWAGNWQREGQG